LVAHPNGQAVAYGKRQAEAIAGAKAGFRSYGAQLSRDL
jgi:hypothetical protein